MPDALTSLELPAEWFLLLLRVLFIFLIYFFLYQLFRVQLRELVVLGTVAASRPEAPPAHRVVVLEGGSSPDLVGQSFLLQQHNSVGRHQTSAIQLDEPFVSTNHAEIAFTGGRWWVTDFASTNGTRINDQPVQGTAGVQPGDIVQFGRVKLRLEA